MDTLLIFLLGIGWVLALFLPAIIIAAVLMRYFGDRLIDFFLGDE